MVKDNRRFVDLFAGCGGMTLGLMQAGWEGIFVAEKSPMAFKTIEANFLSPSPSAKGLRLDWPDFLPVGPIPIESLLDGHLRHGIAELKNKISLVSGGPPCQGFSFNGLRQQDDPRNRLIDAYAQFVVKVQPTLLLIENVPGILVPHGKKQRAKTASHLQGQQPKSYATRLLERLTDTYHFCSGIVDAAHFGVPQHRKRFFGVGILRSALPSNIAVIDNRVCCISPHGIVQVRRLDPFFVLESIRHKFLRDRGLDPDTHVSARDAIEDLAPHKTIRVRPCTEMDSRPGFNELDYFPPSLASSNAYVRLMRYGMNGSPPDGLRLARHTDRVTRRLTLMLANCRKGVRLDEGDRLLYGTEKHRVVPLAPDKPAHTLTTLPDDLVHYKHPRTLTLRESARLQSFPDWFVFKGKYTSGGLARRTDCPRFTQVGNAVPPLLATAWGFALHKLLTEVERRGNK